MALTRPKYSQIYDTDWKQSVELATTADVGNLVLANVQPNSIDGITVQTNYRILVKDQNSGAQNGIYLVRDAGTGSNGWWTRSLDTAQSSFVTAGLTVSVNSGSLNGGKEFKLTTPDPITLDTTPLTFINPNATATPAGANTQVQFNDAGTTNATSGFTFNKYTNNVAVVGNVTAQNTTISNVVTQGVSPYISNQYVMYGTTNNATETELFINGVSGARIPVANNTTMMYETNIIGRRTDSANVSASWHHKGAADNFSGYVADVGNLYEIVIATDDANLAVDTRVTSSNIGVYVTGIAGQTFRWVAVVRTSEVSQ